MTKVLFPHGAPQTPCLMALQFLICFSRITFQTKWMKKDIMHVKYSISSFFKVVGPAKGTEQ